jgi:hypothetical protein
MVVILLTSLPALAQDQGTVVPTRSGMGLLVFESDDGDILGESLERLGLTRSDLGYRPRGSWSRYPLPGGVPYINTAFEDLFSRPLVIPRYIHGMADPVRRYLAPDNLTGKDDALYQLAYYLGVEKFAGGFRNYSANCITRVEGDEPLLTALLAIEQEFGGGGPQGSFGDRYDTGEDPHGELLEQLAPLSPELRTILAKLVINLTDAVRWTRLSFRRADRDLLERALRAEIGSTENYLPCVDDLAAVWDRRSLCYGALKTAQAMDSAGLELATLDQEHRQGKGILLDISTALGRVVVSGDNGEEYRPDNCLLWLDLGGDDTYLGAVAGSRGPSLPVSTLLDLGGDDRYQGKNGTQGSGLLGVGLLLDLAGDDRYEAEERSQGFGQFGFGMLADFEGKDDWQLESAGQGAGYFGIGIHLDGSGNDNYYLLGEGQGFGGVGGVGVLASWGGNDKYTAEPYAEIAGRADYHSDHLIAANSAQGCGMGRRGDGSDGHSWAGGLGAMIDIHGKDEYLSGNWSLGVGFWYGIGLLYEGGGDDTYRSVYFTQASGAHFCIGAILDEGGDDQHILFENAGAGIGFGWDYAVSMLLDTEGDDLYQAKIISLGLSDIRSNAFLIDLHGDDTYRLDGGQLGFGATDTQEYYGKSRATAPYYEESLSVGLLLDGGGADSYEIRDPEQDTFKADTLLADTIWRVRPRVGSGMDTRGCFGAFWDTELKSLPEIEHLLEH